MKPFELYIAYVAWGGIGKRRPVLIRSHSGGKVLAYPITSQPRSKFFYIENWASSGLRKPSYVDLGKLISICQSKISTKPIGHLTNTDRARLMEALAARA